MYYNTHIEARLCSRAVARAPRRPTKEYEVQRKTYRVHEVTALLGIGKSTVYKLIGEGTLQRIKVGATTLITAASVDALLPPHAV